MSDEEVVEPEQFNPSLLAETSRECERLHDVFYRTARRYDVAQQILRTLSGMRDRLQTRSMYEALFEKQFNFDCITNSHWWWPGRCDVLCGMALYFLETMFDFDGETLVQLLMSALPETGFLTRQLLAHEKVCAKGQRPTNFARLDRALYNCGEFLHFGATYLEIARANSEWMDEDE